MHKVTYRYNCHEYVNRSNCHRSIIKHIYRNTSAFKNCIQIEENLKLNLKRLEKIFVKMLTALIPHNCCPICKTETVISCQRTDFSLNMSNTLICPADVSEFASTNISSISSCTSRVPRNLYKAERTSVVEGYEITKMPILNVCTFFGFILITPVN